MTRIRNVMVSLSLTILFVLNLSMAPPLRLGQITPDYGILSERDFQEVLDSVVPACWSYKKECPTHYWQCMPTDRIVMKCVLSGTLHDGADSYLSTLYLQTNDQSFEFFTRRPWRLDDCEADLKIWSYLLSNQDTVCIAAMLMGEKERGMNTVISTSVIFRQMDRIKTEHGSWAYFCDEDYDICS